MGFLVAVIGMGLAAGDSGTALATAFYAAHHLLVKGALFLAVGAVMLTGRRHRWPMLVPAAVIALGLGGLPLTGGALAKYAAKDLLGEGLAGSVAVVSSIATTLLMIHFLRRLSAMTAADPDARAPAAMAGRLARHGARVACHPVGALSVDSDRHAANGRGAGRLVGRAMAGAGGCGAGVRLGSAWGADTQLPAGDMGEVLYPLEDASMAAGGWFERVDAFSRRWAVSCIALLLVSLLFGWTLMVVG